MYIKEPPEEINEAYRRLFRILLEYKAFADQHRIILVVMLFPQRYQIQSQDWTETVSMYGLEQKAFDLEAPNRRINTFCKEQSILVIDATEKMRREWGKKHRAMYLPLGDMHWNSHGHRVFFESVRDEIVEAVRLAAHRKRQY